ncbi:MAG: hypothetical protein KF689_06300 [Gemmatimonadaceae bacterium]|nr:hypothetical protein [Gemmatimonadaceae bacterium]MCW5825215.1 hypothetical protein [Gemmatimonadaceae bacterium]
MRWMRSVGVLVLLLLSTASAGAQRATDAERDSLESRVRARMAQMMRTQLGLNDDQVRQLQATNRRFEGQRRALFEQERRVRAELRTALDAATPDQEARVGTLLDRTLALQRQRLELTEAEQKELATFLTPTQRARLYGIEEQMRRRMDEMRDNRPRPGQPPGGRRPFADGPPATRRPPQL